LVSESDRGGHDDEEGRDGEAPEGLLPPDADTLTVRSHLEHLRRRAKSIPTQEQEHLEEALEQLSMALEEMLIAETTVRQQNEDLSATQTLLDEERRRYRDLFDFAPEAYIVTDLGGTIEELNRAATTLLGWRQMGLVGKPLTSYVDPAERGEFRQRLAELATVPRIADWPVRLRTASGGSVQASVTVDAVRESERSVASLRWLIRDAGNDAIERQRIEAELSFRRSLLESQSEASVEGILVVDADGSIVSSNRRFMDMWGIPEDVIASRSDEAALGFLAEKLSDPEAFRRRAAHLYANPREEGLDEIALRDGRVFSRYTAPVIGPGDTFFGRVWFFRDISEERDRERERDELLVRAETARAQAEAAMARLRKLQAITDVMLSHVGVEELLKGLLDAVREALGTDTATLLLLTPDGKNLAVRAVSGEPEEIKGEIRVPMGKGIAGRIALERRPRIVDNVPAAGPHSLALRTRVKSLIGVPLIVADRVIGVVHAATFTPRAFTNEDVHLLELVAERAGVAIENASLYDAEQRARHVAEEAARQTAALQSVTAALSEAVSPEEVAKVAMDQGIASLGAVAGLVALVSENGTQLDIVQARGYPAGMLEKWRRFPMDGPFPLSESVRTGKPVLLEDIRARQDRYPQLNAMLQLPDQAVAAIPMSIEGRAIGGLVFRFEEPRVFGEQDVPFMVALARQSALAIERARLFEAERGARQVSEVAQLRMAFLAEASAILSGSLEMPSALESLARLSVTFLTDLCLIDVRQEDGSIKRVASVHADPSKQALADLLRTRYAPDPFGPHPAVKVLETARPDFAEEMTEDFLRRTTKDEEHLRIVQELGFQSYMCVPLLTRDRALGTFTLVSCSPDRRYGPADVGLAEELARRAAFAIDNALLYQAALEAGREAEQAAERTAALQSVSAALAEALTPAEVAEVIVERGLAALSASAGSIVLLSPDRSELVLLRAFGYVDQIIEPWTRFPADAAVPLADAVRTGDALFLASPNEADKRFPGLISKRSSGNQGWAAIPLTVEGRTIGAIGVSFPEPRDFPEEERTFMLALGRQCAQALERARLYEAERAARAEAEEAEDRLAFLAEASEVLASSLDIEITLSSIARLAVPRLADWCTIDLLDEDGTIRQVAVTHRDPSKEALARELRERYPPEREPPHPIWKVLFSGEPELASEIGDHGLVARAKDPLHVKLLRQVGIRSHMVVPLVARGKTMGTISLIRGEPGRPYRQDDLILAENLGQRAAVAIDNSRLYHAELAAREEAERAGELQRNIAQTLQRSLLPASLPDIPDVELAARYRAAGEGNEVGGDFYDAFEVVDGAWILTIGDVCGKGPEAAAVTGLARHTLRAVAFHEPRPSRILSMLNDAILREIGDERFCTVCCIRVRPSTGGFRITVSSGGHPLPLVLRADGSVESAGRPSLLLGVLPEVDPTDHALDLWPGDAIVLYTDGVVEEDRLAIEPGTQRLARIVQVCAGKDAAGIAAAIERSVVELGPEAPRDDFAVLVLRVEP
jgi:PAS domain S-box-containing protein